ncbi:S-adenosyl-L-methionine-dependent methyltransferase [Aspergillus karnatakaensis]|uniref:protein-arginine N5-methyltransferase n=1 Tax=Aspergillus karnatakaensis TaxID=1810916 RepID=UPI003CCCBD9C
MADATEIDVDIDVQEILLAASQHDIPKLRRLLRAHDAVGNPANVKDPETGYSPLHAAVAACENDDEEEEAATNGNGVQTNGEGHNTSGNENENVQAAVQTVKLLLQEGAIWNDLDLNDETPGCVALRLGVTEVYEMLVDAGVRAELLLNRLEGYEELEDDDDYDDGKIVEDAEEEGEELKPDEELSVPALVQVTRTSTTAPIQPEATETDPNVTSTRYLTSDLSFQHDRLLDQDQNGVMMAWETEIMAKSAKQLLPTPGLRVLNVGHGMGIVDGFFQEQSPEAHHIIEAHPSVVAEMKRKGWADKPGVTIHEGRWQDILPNLVTEGVMFDAIYYDTFAESYADFREFFTEQVIGVLEQDGKWGFFNGMGADRQISYDVYQKVVEMDLFEAGFDVAWEEIEVPKLEDEWNGVRRPYWNISKYRLPLCKFMD